jgi:spore maturation protein CgeB
MWKIFGCEGAYVGPYVPGIEQFARPDEHCCWFRSVDDAVAQLAALLRDPDRRREMAARARAHALAHHTYEDRMRRLLCGEAYPLD